MAKKNIVITGMPGSGKTTLVTRLLAGLGESPVGYTTVRKELSEDGMRWGFFLEELPERERNAQIMEASGSELFPKWSRIPSDSNVMMRGKWRVEVFPEAFETTGVMALEHAILAPDRIIIVMDEIGRFEKNAVLFQKKIAEAMDSRHPILAVMKKEEIPFHRRYLCRPDAVIYDLDLIRWKSAYEEIREYLQKQIGKEMQRRLE